MNKFRNIKVCLKSRKQSYAVQVQLFDDGAKWESAENFSIPANTDEPFLTVTEDGYVRFFTSSDAFDQSDRMEVTPEMILNNIDPRSPKALLEPGASILKSNTDETFLYLSDGILLHINDSSISGWWKLSDFDDDLKHPSGFEIVSISKVRIKDNRFILNADPYMELVWERPSIPVKEVTLEEIEKLYELMYNVKIKVKVKQDG